MDKRTELTKSERRLRQRRYALRNVTFWDGMWTSLGVGFFLLYPTTVRLALSALGCQPYGGRDLLRDAPSVQCWLSPFVPTHTGNGTSSTWTGGGSYQHTMMLAWFAVPALTILAVLVPLWVAFRLRQRQRQKRLFPSQVSVLPRSAGSCCATSKPLRPQIIFLFIYLFFSLPSSIFHYVCSHMYLVPSHTEPI